MLRFLVCALMVVLSPLARASEPVHVNIVGDVDDSSVRVVRDAVKQAQTDHAPRIEVFINSPGGAVFPGLEILAALNGSGVPVVCTVGDLAASMAAIILEAGCSRRIVHETSIIMFHEAKGSASDTMSEGAAKDMAAVLRAINLSMALRVAKRIGLTVEQYAARAIGREWWVVGFEAGILNVADEIVPVSVPTPITRG